MAATTDGQGRAAADDRREHGRPTDRRRIDAIERERMAAAEGNDRCGQSRRNDGGGLRRAAASAGRAGGRPVRAAAAASSPSSFNILSRKYY